MEAQLNNLIESHVELDNHTVLCINVFQYIPVQGPKTKIVDYSTSSANVLIAIAFEAIAVHALCSHILMHDS